MSSLTERRGLKHMFGEDGALYGGRLSQRDVD